MAAGDPRLLSYRGYTGKCKQAVPVQPQAVSTVLDPRQESCHCLIQAPVCAAQQTVREAGPDDYRVYASDRRTPRPNRSQARRGRLPEVCTMEVQVVFHERRDEVVAVVIAGVAPQFERLPGVAAGALECFRI